jgi:cysteine synthase A
MSDLHTAIRALEESQAPTPLVRLRWAHFRVWAKCEFALPTGSHKDRAYTRMVLDLWEKKTLRPGITLCDYTTGNGGISLASVGMRLGLPVRVFMPAGLTREREEMIRKLGATLVLTPHEDFVAGARAGAEAWVDSQDGDAVLISQSDNPLNRAAFEEAGEEIVAELGRANVQPQVFVCGIGTGGIFSGIAARLREEYPRLRTVAIEVPEAPAILAKRRGEAMTPRPHRMIGFGPGKIAPNTLEDLVDEVELVEYDEALAVLDEIAHEDGLLCGPTSAANALVARRHAEALGEEGAVVTVFFDRQDRYSSVLGSH